MPTQFPCELVSWNQVANLALKLARKIQQKAFEPDIIIAIGRGGYVPARLLADYLDMMALTDIKVEHYRSTEQLPSAIIKYGLSTDVNDMQVLLVDDVSDSGDTFRVATEHILQYNKPAQIKTAALHHKITSRLTPDFFAAKIIKWRWLIYPWAQFEDISSFFDKLSPAPHDKYDALRRLQQAYGIRVSDKMLDYVWDRRAP